MGSESVKTQVNLPGSFFGRGNLNLTRLWVSITGVCDKLKVWSIILRAKINVCLSRLPTVPMSCCTLDFVVTVANISCSNHHILVGLGKAAHHLSSTTSANLENYKSFDVITSSSNVKMNSENLHLPLVRQELVGIV